LIDESAGPFGVEAVFPGHEGLPADTDEGGKVACGQAAALPGIEQQEALRGREMLGTNPGRQRLVVSAEHAPLASGAAVQRRCGRRRERTRLDYAGVMRFIRAIVARASKVVLLESGGIIRLRRSPRGIWGALPGALIWGAHAAGGRAILSWVPIGTSRLS
jgi:hypothetical protein